METFLHSIAKAYLQHYGGSLSDVCFVFPGKRAGSFFLRCLQSMMHKRVEILPAVTSISDFVEKLSGRVIDSRIDMVCLLYDLYRRSLNPQQETPPFDKFMSWADVILSDFNDVEMYRVNPDALFRNVKQLKNIRSNYLTDEQMQVMHRYFGYKDFYNVNTGHLWQHYAGEGTMPQRFRTLFDSLGGLYSDFCESLESRGLTFPGKAYAQALQALNDNASAALPYKRVVMVGFNALTTVEFLIFKTLARSRVSLDNGTVQPLADFYWDCTGVPLGFDDNIGRHFVERNRKHFPSLYDISNSECTELPQRIRVIASPSGVAQAKIAGELLDDILHRCADVLESNFVDTDVAVVLPDENLLLPMLYSMPQKLQSVNLTMGYPFAMTTVATFVALLENYRHNLRVLNRDWIASYADVEALLSNPLMLLLAGADDCANLLKVLRMRRRSGVPVSMLTDAGEECSLIFTPLGLRADATQAIEYLLQVLQRVSSIMEQGLNPDNMRIRRLDYARVLLYIDALRRVKTALADYHIAASASAAFRMASRLLATEVVRFEGEPLEGVQVMGPLETRSIDFKYLIIPSMNERIYPRRLHQRSFIPAVVRRGFGMATQHFQEAIFTYYFYRMISRAREVYLIYDSRTEGLHSGSPSRFILQLQYLYAKEKIENSRYRFDVESRRRTFIEIKKSETIIKQIEEYFSPRSKKRLSASSLNNLIECTLRFYLQNLCGINQESLPADGMQGNDLGSIVHKALQYAYGEMSVGEPPFTITERMLLDTAADNATLQRLVVKAINEEYYKRPDSAYNAPDEEMQIFVPLLAQTVANVLRYDAVRIKNEKTFTLLSAEKREPITYTMPDGSNVNFIFVIDRVDCSNFDNPQSPLRIVDYKTGHFNVSAASVEDIFASDHPGELLQLILYAILYKERYGTSRQIFPIIYNVQKMADPNADKVVVSPSIARKPIIDIEDVKNEFLTRLQQVLSDLRNPSIPFSQAAEGADICKYCPFAGSVCGVITKEN